MRENIKKHYIGMTQGFRFRGEEPTRIETLSDAGFALAIGLLLISTTSPTTSKQLFAFTSELIPFGLCIALIMMVWYQHFIFFLRYGFRNAFILVLNTALIFIILFYVYPLKFLTKLLTLIYSGLLMNLMGLQNNYGKQISIMLEDGDMSLIMIIYGLGATAIFLVLASMYWYAYKKAFELELNKIELFDTQVSVYKNILMSSIPFLSVIILIVFPKTLTTSIVSGIIYMLYFPVMMAFSIYYSKRRKQLEYQ